MMTIHRPGRSFPFLFGGTFIEGKAAKQVPGLEDHFPSFSEGLSLRVSSATPCEPTTLVFPFLFGGTFIEGASDS